MYNKKRKSKKTLHRRRHHHHHHLLLLLLLLFSYSPFLNKKKRTIGEDVFSFTFPFLFFMFTLKGHI